MASRPGRTRKSGFDPQLRTAPIFNQRQKGGNGPQRAGTFGRLEVFVFVHSERDNNLALRDALPFVESQDGVGGNL